MRHPAGHCPRGALNALHHSAATGSAGRVSNILSKGSIGINDPCCPDGRTPLLFAADGGHTRVVKILLKSGAAVTAVCDGGVTALHMSARCGHVAVTNLLVKAGADLEAADDEQGYTPLHLAVQFGRCRVVEALIEAGATVDHTLRDGATPMYLAAETGQLGALKLLLAANADPHIKSGNVCTPLEVATEKGYTEIVREFVANLGIDRCGGSTRGAFALQLAAQAGALPIMEILYAAGTRDEDGEALCSAVTYGGQHALNFLLQRPEVFKTGCVGGASYVNHSCKSNGLSPLLCCLTENSLKKQASRVLRRLIDAGADTSTTYSGHHGNTDVGYTALELVNARVSQHYLTNGLLDDGNIVRGLHALRHLLMREEAIHAVSWGWPTADRPAAALTTENSMTLPLPLPPMRRERRAIKSRVVLRALLRYNNVKRDGSFVSIEGGAGAKSMAPSG